MTTPILTTKLYIPPPRPQAILRPRLIERLNEGLQGQLTLISAPAGFGKTTLVSSWINELRVTNDEYQVTSDELGRARGVPATGAPNDDQFVTRYSSLVTRWAWLSLDEDDSNLARFLAYLTAALQRAAPGLGEGVPAMLHTPQPPPTETLLTALINEITALREPIALVLDDYHVIDAQPIDAALAFLIDHLPPQLHLIITSREDPRLPLPRYRARGRLSEVRADDLRFTSAEAAAFLNAVTDLDLSAEEIRALEQRTEGWIAGLQLAALSMQGRADVHGFVQTFAGDNRYIVDYLAQEVLQQQPESVRRFLLQTSILDRLCGPLCDAVVGQTDGSALLTRLERDNLFVIPLDDKRQWFRYHHLFADVLQAYLLEEQSDRIPTLHRRASEWYAQHDLPAAAIRHALAADDLERAATLLELAWPAMDRDRQYAAWLAWVQALPDELIRTRPVLSTAYAWAYLDAGDLESAAARLRDAERWLAKGGEATAAEPDTDGMVVADETQFRLLPASIATARTYLAQAHGDVPGTLHHAREALQHTPADDHLRRAVPASLLALAYWHRGELAAAARTMTGAMESFQLAGNTLYVITGAYVLADMQKAQGRLLHAFSTLHDALQLAEGQSEPVQWGTADLHTSLGELYRERNDLKAAAAHLQHSKALGEQADLSRWRFRWCIAQAYLLEAHGKLDDALDRIEQAERDYVRGPVPDVRPIGAMKARFWIARGRMADVRAWVRDRGLSTDASLNYLQEYEHITLARALLAEAARERSTPALSDAVDLLRRLLRAANAGERLGSVLELLVLQALARAAQGDRDAALDDLARALTLAEPEGYVRLFVDEGPLLKDLLATLRSRAVTPAYVDRLLAAYDVREQPGAALSPPADIRAAPADQPLIEPLSERELEVLRLVAQGLSNRQIAERLFLALSTVKGHNRNIFGKLQVQRRTEAAARARELGLLD